MICIEYKNIKINFNECDEEWYCDEGGRHKSLKEVKNKIDRYIIKENKSKRFDIYLKSWRSLEKVTITSKTQDGCYWYKTQSGNRGKTYKNDFMYTINEHNNKIVKRLKEINENIKSLNQKQNDLMKSLQKYQT